MIDIHSHILPGVDDGAETLTDSVNMVRELAEQGVTEIIATPHYVTETIYTAPRPGNLRRLEDLKQAIANEGLKVELHLGNEIYINEQIKELIRTGEIATLAKSKYLLVELPMSGDYPNHQDVLQALMEDGYRVILAHPERYVAIQNDFEIVRELYNAGVLLQCNLGSMVGQYGKHAKKTVQRLAKEGMIFAMGSDIHHVDNRWQLEEVHEKLKKYYSDAELEQIMIKNPGEIIAGGRDN